MNLRRVFVEWPARLFDAWWTAYGLVLLITVVVLVLALAWLLVTYSFGIRWGW